MTRSELRPSILVVDDSDMNLDILVHALAEDHRALVATNGATGLERACREVPDLMAVADVYDALTSKRCYKEPISHDAAVKTILEGDGRTLPSHFCPMVLEVFRTTQPLFERISVEWHDT